MDNASFIMAGYKENKVITWITAFLLYMLLYPYFVWSFVDSFEMMVFFPLYVIFFFNSDWNKDLGLFAFFVLLTLFIGFNHHANLFGYFFTVAVSIVYIAKKGFVFSVYKHFWQLYVVLILLSMISMLLVKIGVPLPYVLISPLNSLKNYYYMAYPFYIKEIGIESIRFCGLFDEPGSVGTTSLILLFIEKFNFKRFGNIVLLISGLLSLSLFFYLALAIFMLFQIFNKEKGVKNRIFLLVVLITGFVFVFFNPITKESILERTIWDKQKGSISGDTRAAEDLKSYIKSIRWSDEYFLGSSQQIAHEYAKSASLQNAVLQYGFIVVLLYFVFYGLYARSYLHFGWKWLLFMLFLFMVLYNRPTMFNITRIFLFNTAMFSLVNTSSSIRKV